MRKRGFLSEFNSAQILRRYNAVTVMGLLREVAKWDNARLDWNVVAKKLDASIGSARECQALWRHIAYRKELADFYEEDEQPSDDESDLEFDVLPAPAVSSEANAEAVRWVKTDMQRFDIGGGKKKGEAKSKSRPQADAGLLTDFNQGLPGGGKDGSQKGASNGNTISPPAGAGCLVDPECTLSRVALGQSERKKRKLWSVEEDEELIAAVEKFGEGNWTNILKGSFTHERTAAQLSQRWALIRKRREAVQAAANRPTTSAATEQGNGASPPDQSLPTSSAQKGTNPVAQNGHPTEKGAGAAQNGTGPTQNGSPAQNGTHAEQNGSPAQNGTTPAQNGGNSASVSQPVVPPKTPVENGCVGDVVAPNTAMASSGCQSQDHASSPSKGLNRASNGSAPTSSCMESVALKGGARTSIPAASSGGQQLTGAGAARSTAGSSTPMAVGQIHSPSANVSAGVGTGRLIAPGAVVMSAAAAQAASVGVSETRQAATLASTGSLPSGPTTKYVVRSNGRGASSKAVTGPDPGVQAAAVAAGARIAPASTLLQAAHSGNGVHIRPGGVPVTKSGLPSQTGMGHNASGGSRGTSGAIVHYITTQRPAQQTKNQAGKANGTSQASSSAALNGSMSPTKLTPPPK